MCVGGGWFGKLICARGICCDSVGMDGNSMWVDLRVFILINLGMCLYFVWNSSNVRMVVWREFCIWVTMVISILSNSILIHHNHMCNMFVGNTISLLQCLWYSISLTICRYTMF